jgi:hypothetical protein
MVDAGGVRIVVSHAICRRSASQGFIIRLHPKPCFYSNADDVRRPANDSAAFFVVGVGGNVERIRSVGTVRDLGSSQSMSLSLTAVPVHAAQRVAVEAVLDWAVLTMKPA